MNAYELKAHTKKVTKTKEVKELVDAVIAATNTMGAGAEVAQGIAEALFNNHPTLIQSFMGAFKAACEIAAENPRYKHGGDLRIQSTSQFIKEVAKMDVYFPYI